jgi:hypothetical protein
MRVKETLFLAVCHVIISLISFAGEKNDNKYYYQNAVYREEIKSVQLYPDGNKLSNPVIELNGDVQLILKFDDLSGAVKDYSYTIVHCDAGWNESFIMQNEYLDGFPDNPINDYAFSLNTTVTYVNYRLMIPNEDVKLNYSGNYAVVVFEDNDKEKLVLIRRFHVIEPLARVEGRVKKATFDPFKGENQEVDFDIYTESLRIQDPHQEIKVVLTQNRRWDNAIRDLKPLFIRNEMLSYDYNKENVFPGGNEFRWFDIRTNRYPGDNIESVKFHRPYYHATLVTDEVRSNKKYFYNKEMNGNYVIESRDQVQDFDTECDYIFVHFTLPLPVQLVGGSVNVFGALTDWNANKSNEMSWNAQTAAYELTLLLKQGYYNYQYVYVPTGSAVADATNIEGSFYETENDYQIFVYYKEMGGRYDRLVGFRQLNSRN